MALVKKITTIHIASHYDNHLATTTRIIIVRFLSEFSERKHFEKEFVNLEVLRDLLSLRLYLRSMSTLR